MAGNDSGEFDEFEDTDQDESEQEDTDQETEESFEEDLESIELDEPVVSQSGGVRGLTIVLLIIFLAVAAYSIYWHIQRQAEIRAAQEAKEQRVQTYKAQLATVRDNVMEAKSAFEKNDVEAGAEALETAKKKLTIIGTQANESNDQQWARFVMQKKDHLRSADEKIAEKVEKYREAKETMEEARREMQQAIDEASSKFENIDLSGGSGGSAQSSRTSPAPERSGGSTQPTP